MQIAKDGDAIAKWNSYIVTGATVSAGVRAKAYQDCISGEFDLIAKRDQSPYPETKRRANLALRFLNQKVWKTFVSVTRRGSGVLIAFLAG